MLEVQSQVARKRTWQCQTLLDKVNVRNVPNACIHVDLVLPLELSPHATELRLIHKRRLDVVHDVNMDVVENDVDAWIGAAVLVVDDVSKDNAGFR